ncbi:hypothetical protein SEVIR_8G131650v4 [Setaria viridis]|uniref:Uncharacterized protein n=1 Tax=Setaria italica TaxID=4555 RepID=A0A368S709_SETIT|nr:hypothetical protein SETIT_8G124700v2 [Setaria italica]
MAASGKKENLALTDPGREPYLASLSPGFTHAPPPCRHHGSGRAEGGEGHGLPPRRKTREGLHLGQPWRARRRGKSKRKKRNDETREKKRRKNNTRVSLKKRTPQERLTEVNDAGSNHSKPNRFSPLFSVAFNLMASEMPAAVHNHRKGFSGVMEH